MNNQIGIKINLFAFRIDGTNAIIEELEEFNDALIELAVKHGFQIGGTVSLCDDDGQVTE